MGNFFVFYNLPYLLTQTNISLWWPPVHHATLVCQCLSVSQASVFHLSLLLFQPVRSITTLPTLLKVGYWFIICQCSSRAQANQGSYRCWRGRAKRAMWSSVPVAKPICVSLLECPSENMLWAWEGWWEPISFFTAQLPQHAFSVLPRPHIASFPHQSLLHLNSPSILCFIQIFPGHIVELITLCALCGQSFTTQNYTSTSYTKTYRVYTAPWLCWKGY